MSAQERAKRAIALEKERLELRLKLLDHQANDGSHPMTDELKARYEARLAAVDSELAGLA